MSTESERYIFCAQQCQYAVDVGIPEHQCTEGCWYRELSEALVQGLEDMGLIKPKEEEE